MSRQEDKDMDAFELTELRLVRLVLDERHDHGNHDFEARKIELMKRCDDYYLVYSYDPFPGGYGEIRCEGIVHINAAESRKDNEALTKLYFDTGKEYLIETKLTQKEMTLTCLTGAYCQDRVCFVWCASSSLEERTAGCIELSRYEMDAMTAELLTSVLKVMIPEGTVIPPFRLYRKGR